MLLAFLQRIDVSARRRKRMEMQRNSNAKISVRVPAASVHCHVRPRGVFTLLCPDVRVQDASRLPASPATGSCPSVTRTSGCFPPWPPRTFRPHTQLRAGAVYFMNGSFRKSAKGAGLSPPAIMWRAVSARSQSQRGSCSPPRQNHSAAPGSTELRDTSPAGVQLHGSAVFFS